MDACLGKDKVSAPFSYASRLTETILLGVIAGRFPNKTLHWDNDSASFLEKEANKFLYISMAWWLDDSVGRELFNEVKSLSKKNVDIRVEMRPDPKNEQIQQKL